MLVGSSNDPARFDGSLKDFDDFVGQLGWPDPHSFPARAAPAAAAPPAEKAPAPPAAAPPSAPVDPV